MRNQRATIGNRILCFVLALALVFGLGAISAYKVSAADAAKPDTNISAGKDLFDLEKKAPAELDAYPENVYDVDKGEAFLLSEQNELAFLVTDEGNKSMNKSMYRFDDLNMAMTLKESEDLIWVDGVNVSNAANDPMPAGKIELYDGLAHAQSVGFDAEGTGRREYIATVGYNKNTKLLQVIMQNAKTGNGRIYTLDSANWMSGAAFWLMDNYFAVTAGDYDGDGKDSVIVYSCGDGNNVKLIEFYYSGSNAWKKQTILSLDTVVKNTTYKTTSDLKYKPTVGLATGDFDGNGTEELAFSAGFYNTSDSAANGYQNFACDNLEQFATTVGIMEYKSGAWSRIYTTSLYDQSSKYTMANNQKTYPLTIMHGGMIAAGDVNNDGMDEIVAVGYMSLTQDDVSNGYAAATYNSQEKLLKVSGVCNWSDSLVSSVIYRSEGSKKYLRTDLTSFEMPEVLGYNYREKCRESDYAFARLAMACGKTNGNSANEDVFISGVLYDFSSFVPTAKYASHFTKQEMKKITGGSGAGSSVNWIKNVAAANFDQNDAGREQFVFTLWGKESGKENYSANLGVITGIDFDDVDSAGKKAPYGSKDVVSFGAPNGYACNLNVTDMTKGNYPIHSQGDNCKGYTQVLARASSGSNPNAVPVAVDIDNDGLMGRFSSKGYVYTDPALLAVLEAGPYYEELADDELGGYSDPCGTSFCVSTGYGTGTSSGDTVSFEAGVALDAAGPCVQTSLEMGYSMEWSHTYEKTYTVTKKKTFAAQEYDTVVLSRVPVLVYTYDLFSVTNEETGEGKWVVNGYNVRVPLSPRYFMLSIDEYNRFVDTFNKMIGNAGNKLIKIEEDKDLPAGHEGVPDNYWKNWAQAGEGAERISDEEFRLSYVSGFSSSEKEDEEETTVSDEMSHGFHYSLTMQGGGDLVVGEAWAGGYVNLDYSHSKGTSKTTVYSKGTAGQVQNLNKAALLKAGMTEEEVEAYGFTWQFGKWTRVLTEDGVEVPFYGYIVYDACRPDGPPRISGRARFELEEGYEQSELAVMVSGNPAPGVSKVVGKENFTLSEGSEEGVYKIMIAPGLPVGTHKVVIRAKNKNGSSDYTCMVTVTKSSDQQKADRVSRMIRALELYDLDVRSEFGDTDDYQAVYDAYHNLTDAQKAYLTEADISKMEAAVALARIGYERRLAQDEAMVTLEKLDAVAYWGDSFFLTEDGLNELKEFPEPRQAFLSDEYPNLVGTVSEAYRRILNAQEPQLEILLRDHNLMNWIERLMNVNEKITQAFNYAKERFDDDALYRAHDEADAQRYEKDIEALDAKQNRAWSDVCDLFDSYLNWRAQTDSAGEAYSEADRAALLQNMHALYGMLRDSLDYGEYKTGKPLEYYYSLGETADRATDVAYAIDNLPKYDAVSVGDQETIAEARAAYAGLTEEQQQLIGPTFPKMLEVAEEYVAAAIAELPDIRLKAKVTGIPTSYVYNGKAKSPAPVLTIGTKRLAAGKDYTVSYKNNKNVGTATVTIQGCGGYRGTITKTFMINPKPTTLKKPGALKKGFTAKWKKQAVQTTGYQLQYSLKKNFKKAKTVTIKKTGTLSKKITKLKSRKTYYIRIRTYKKVGGKTYYSTWSKSKSIKTK